MISSREEFRAADRRIAYGQFMDRVEREREDAVIGGGRIADTPRQRNSYYRGLLDDSALHGRDLSLC